MRHLPVFVDLRGQTVVVAGAGKIATAKLRSLVKTEARLKVFGTEPSAEVRRWANRGALELHPYSPRARDLAGARLVYAASTRNVDNRHLCNLARAAGILVNVADDLASSSFISPAVVDRDPVVVAIGTGGTAPLLARRIKARIEGMLPSGIGALARLASKLRPAARAVPSGQARRRFWSWFFEGAAESALERFGETGARRAIHAAIGRWRGRCVRTGRVLLVGAGPGDPDLLTQRARRALAEADVVLHDRLVDPRVLELARREAELVEMGKCAGGPAWKQADITAEMIHFAQAGYSVVRLKSGDPMLFGRADEEIDALADAGIEYSVVPGITSGTAASAAMRTSLTRRNRNSAISFITAQDARGYAEQDWRYLSRPDTTFGIYMGVRAARFVQGRLLLHGADPQTPVCVVEAASRPGQRILNGELATLDTLLETYRVVGPAIIFVGLRARADAVTGTLESPAAASVAR